MTPDDLEQRAHLQRLAFGRSGSPAERQRAAEALRQLQNAQANDIYHPEVATPAHDATLGADNTADTTLHDASDASLDAGSTPAGEAPEASVFDRPLSALPRWLIPGAAVGLIAVGAVVGFAGGTSASSTAALGSGFLSPYAVQANDTSPLDVDVDELPVVSVGDISATEHWFASEQTEEDLYPQPNIMIDPTTTRLVLRAPGDEPWNVWIARNSDNSGYCLSVFHLKSAMAETACAETASFVSSGLDLETGANVMVNWNGADITATRLH